MSESMQVRFNDGAQYERFMGRWSQLVGTVFLDWLAPVSGSRWIDVGCGNGAFTQMIVDGTAPTAVHGIDASEAQLDYARKRPASRLATFAQGDAMSLDMPNGAVDVAVMALVIFFVPEPMRGVAEMARVTRPGGRVAAYAWDTARGGFPLEAVWDELGKLGHAPSRPPSENASRMEVMKDLWAQVGLVDVETKEIVAQRSFADFDDFWASSIGPSSPHASRLSPDELETLKIRVRARLPVESSGRIAYSARANAIKGRVAH